MNEITDLKQLKITITSFFSFTTGDGEFQTMRTVFGNFFANGVSH